MSRAQPDSLFADAGRRRARGRAPLAERLRPRTLAEVVGQDELLAEDGLLRREVSAGRLASLLLWGPPGSGKTTLARVLAREAGHEVVELSAVSSGVADLRRVLAEAEHRLGAGGKPTALFVDEIHRFHKGQQDALLHEVEDGRVVLVGATTENPAFHVNAALLSRCRLVRLEPLGDEACEILLTRACGDAVRGLGAPPVTLEETAREALLADANGDGRRLLNQLERAALLAGGEGSTITAQHVTGAQGERLVGQGRGGDSHYDLLSALHKSLRGSDPDAAAYWIERLLAAGEDPRVIARRLVAMASEDVGLADPRALGVALDALRAVEFLGMPEGERALVQAGIYLSIAPKSNAVDQATKAARAAVERRGALEVPAHLRQASTRLAREQGHGKGYRDPHAEPGAISTMRFLPEDLTGTRFFRPNPRGFEVRLAERMAELRQRRQGAPPRS